MKEKDVDIVSGNNREGEARELGLAGRTARAFIHSPLSPLLFIAMLMMGLLGLIFTPHQEDPQISVPMVDIFVQYPGASSSQVASLAIDPLERVMSEIPGVKHVFSTSRHGEGMVTVQFKVGEQLGPSSVKVHDKIQSNLDRLPPDVQMPLVKPKGVDDVPVVTLTLWSESVDDGILQTLALDLLQNLKRIPNTGKGFVVGGRTEQVRVEVRPERLSGFAISLDQVATTIRTANSEQRAGSLESANQYFTVNTGAFLRSVEDVARLVITTEGGVPVYLRDVARIFKGPEETSQMVQFYTGPSYYADTTASGAPAVTLALAKKEGANGEAVANAIIDKVESLKGRLVPDNVNIEITRNYGETVNDKLNELILKLFIAMAAVGILVFSFLGARAAMVVVLVIPVVILLTVFFAWVLGYTIDRVSLFALIFAIGILVGDAVVVIENIYRRWLKKGQVDTATAIDAVREVGNPTILATFTAIAALLPLGFVGGMMGPYMEPISVLAAVAMFFSLIAAFIFTPWLAMRLRPSMAYLRCAEVKEHANNEKLERTFRRILLPNLGNRKLGWTTLIGTVFIILVSCSFFYFNWVTVKMLPPDNKSEFSVMIDLPEGSALPQTVNLANRFARIVQEMPEVTALQTYAGTAAPFDFNGMVRHYYLRSEPWQAQLHVQLLDKDERERTSHEIAVETREKLATIAAETGARITVVEVPSGPPALRTIVAEIYGPDASTRRQVAKDMTRGFEEAQGIADVDNSLQEPHKAWRFEVDTELAMRRGVSVDTINRNLSMAMGNYRLGDIKQGNVLSPTYIVLQVPLSVRASVSRFYELPIPTANGQTIPLAELGKFKQVNQDPVIYHKDLRPVEYVVGEAVGEFAATTDGMFEVEDLMADYVTPDGVALRGEYPGPPEDNGKSGFEWAGEWTVTYETFRDMGVAFGVALVLIYILVVWQFGNFMVPGIIMAPIPLTLIGIIPGHMLMGAEFTATSMIGFIALAGIILRNSILLVDFSSRQVQAGTDVHDAVVLACKTRTRPIVITALALMFASFVILFDPMFQGMAISLLFGTLVSTLLSLVVVPIGCISARAVFCPADGEDGSSNNGEGVQAAAAQGSHQIATFLLASANFIGKLINRTLNLFIYLLVGAVYAVLDSWEARKQRQSPAPARPAETENKISTGVRGTSSQGGDDTDTPGESDAVDESAEPNEMGGTGQASSAPLKTEIAPAQSIPEKTDDRQGSVASDEENAQPISRKTVTVKKKAAVKKQRSIKKATPPKKKAVKKKSVTKTQGTPKGADETNGDSATKKKHETAVKKSSVKKKGRDSSSRRGIRLKKNIDDDFDL